MVESVNAEGQTLAAAPNAPHPLYILQPVIELFDSRRNSSIFSLHL